jgi:hypothetical protein
VERETVREFTSSLCSSLEPMDFKMNHCTKKHPRIYEILLKNIMCPKCECVDDESHRINFCEMWKVTNLFDSEEKVNFDDVFSNEIRHVICIVKIILRNWKTERMKWSLN